jgi:hypothetical protein
MKPKMSEETYIVILCKYKNLPKEKQIEMYVGTDDKKALHLIELATGLQKNAMGFDSVEEAKKFIAYVNDITDPKGFFNDFEVRFKPMKEAIVN